MLLEVSAGSSSSGSVSALIAGSTGAGAEAPKSGTEAIGATMGALHEDWDEVVLVVVVLQKCLADQSGLI